MFHAKKHDELRPLNPNLMVKKHGSDYLASEVRLLGRLAAHGALAVARFRLPAPGFLRSDYLAQASVFFSSSSVVASRVVRLLASTSGSLRRGCPRLSLVRSGRLTCIRSGRLRRPSLLCSGWQPPLATPHLPGLPPPRPHKKHPQICIAPSKIRPNPPT